MRAFLFAAAPWVLMGVALAMIAAGAAQQRKAGNPFGQRLAAGAGLGVVASVVWSLFWYPEGSAACLALGPLLGMALAAWVPGKEKEKS